MTQNKPKISVLVPIYNVEQYLSECVDSILASTLKDIEVILLDDGSKDKSGEISDAYALKDKRVKVVHKQNSGYGATMNVGLNTATGEYIAIVESDDIIRSNMFEKQYALAQSKDIEVLKADFRVFYGEPFDRQFVYRNIINDHSYYDKLLEPLADLNIGKQLEVMIWTGLYKRSFIDQNNIRFHESPGASFQDNGFFFKTYALAKRLWIMNEDFYQLRRDNPNSSVYSKDKAFLMCNEMAWIKEFLDEHQTDFPPNIYSLFWFKTFHNYLFQLDQVNDHEKPAFMSRFQQDFKAAYQEGWIKEPFFNKGTIKDIKKIIKNPAEYMVERNLKRYTENLLDWYKHTMHEDLNLAHPKTYNEKIQWLKLYDSTPIKTKLADKYAVRDWIKDKIGEEYLIPLIGVYDKFDDIDFEKLPNQFVIKCNHGSGYNIIVKDKSQLNLKETQKQINCWMNENFALKYGCELHYRDISPKIIIEKYIEEISSALYDYRFFCFDGKVKQIWLDIYSGTPNHQRKIYDPDWSERLVTVKWPRIEENIPKPKNLDKMIELAEKLSTGFSTVRVDFYDINDKILFGEMTFTSMSGSGKFNPKSEDLRLGKMIKLPKMAYNLDTGTYYKPKYPSKLKQFLTSTHELSLPIIGWIVTPNKYIFKVLGMPLFKKKQTSNQDKKVKRFFVFGLPVLKIKKNRQKGGKKISLFEIPIWHKK